MTLSEVQKGIAKINPNKPNRVPEIIITINISRGWDFTDFENIKGWLKKLSINWPTTKPIITYIVFGTTTELKSWSRFEVIHNINIKNPLIKGPIYGIKFKIAHKKAIIKAFLI